MTRPTMPPPGFRAVRLRERARPFRTGDLVRETAGPARDWRVVAVRDGVHEVICVNEPNLSRFLTHGSIHDPHRYRRVEADDEQD